MSNQASAAHVCETTISLIGVIKTAAMPPVEDAVRTMGNQYLLLLTSAAIDAGIALPKMKASAMRPIGRSSFKTISPPPDAPAPKTMAAKIAKK
jgi:hypothetical protein